MTSENSTYNIHKLIEEVLNDESMHKEMVFGEIIDKKTKLRISKEFEPKNIVTFEDLPFQYKFKKYNSNKSFDNIKHYMKKYNSTFLSQTCNIERSGIETIIYENGGIEKSYKIPMKVLYLYIPTSYYDVRIASYKIVDSKELTVNSTDQNNLEDNNTENLITYKCNINEYDFPNFKIYFNEILNEQNQKGLTIKIEQVNVEDSLKIINGLIYMFHFNVNKLSKFRK